MSGEEGYGEEGYTTIGHEHYLISGRRRRSSTVMFFLLGGLAGAGVALLLTPQAGKITRQQIKEMSRDIRETFSSYYATAFEKIGNAADSGKGLMKQGKPLFMSAIEAGKEAYEKERQRVKREL